MQGNLENDIRHLSDIFLTITKPLVIFCEEVDPSARSNLQIVKELRDAFDHTMRAFDPNGADAAKQIDKAVGHVYRATFDALDGSAISLRQKIDEIVRPYPHHVRLTCIADYAKTAHELNEMTGTIAQLRAEKDIGKDLSATVKTYIAIPIQKCAANGLSVRKSALTLNE